MTVGLWGCRSGYPALTQAPPARGHLLVIDDVLMEELSMAHRRRPGEPFVPRQCVLFSLLHQRCPRWRYDRSCVWTTNKPTDLRRADRYHREIRYSRIPSLVSGVVERSNCRNRPGAVCPDWERTGHTSPVPHPDGIPWFPSRCSLPVGVPSQRQWAPRRTTKHALHAQTETVPVRQPASYLDRWTEKQKRLVANVPCQNQLPGRNRSRPAA